jgi:hypothetical protein
MANKRSIEDQLFGSNSSKRTDLGSNHSELSSPEEISGRYMFPHRWDEAIFHLLTLHFSSSHLTEINRNSGDLLEPRLTGEFDPSHLVEGIVLQTQDSFGYQNDINDQRSFTNGASSDTIGDKTFVCFGTVSQRHVYD